MTEKQTFVIEQVQTHLQSFTAHMRTYEIKDKYQPDAHFELDVKNKLIAENRYEVTLDIEVKVKLSDKELFSAKVTQGGIFQVSGYEKQKEHILESFCPNLLYPYARETISTMVSRAGFPVLYLAPVDFESRFRQMQEGNSQSADSTESIKSE